MKALQDCIALLEDAPEEFHQEALEALMKVVHDYEEWLSLGQPPIWELKFMQAKQTIEMTKRLSARTQEQAEELRKRIRDRRRNGRD